MSTLQSAEAPYEGGRLTRTLAEFRAVGRMDASFGGAVAPDRTGLRITGLCGTHTRSLANLRVTSGNGLGGKSIVMARPVSVVDYVAAQGITHPYDAAVRGEHLATVVALPIVVDRRPRMVVYLANRTQVTLGDRWYDAFAPLVRRVERDIAVEDEVRRRVDALEAAAPPRPPADSPTLGRADLRVISEELSDVAALVTDAGLRQRLEALSARVSDARPRRTPGSRATPISLAAREIDVLEQVALGLSNREAAARLGIVESTVKSYLKHAMRKLQASNRVQAIRLARDAGLIDR